MFNELSVIKLATVIVCCNLFATYVFKGQNSFRIHSHSLSQMPQLLSINGANLRHDRKLCHSFNTH